MLRNLVIAIALLLAIPVDTADAKPPADSTGSGDYDLGFTVANPNAESEAVLYLEKKEQALTLTLTNNSGGSLELVGGTPVPEGQLTKTGPSSLYLSCGLLTTDQLQSLTIEAAGWTAKYFSGALLDEWGLTPSSNVTLEDRQKVAFKITGITTSGKPRPGKITGITTSGKPRPGALNIDYNNFPGIEDDSRHLHLTLRNPPTGPKDLSSTFEAGWLDSPDVIITTDSASPIHNSLTFNFRNTSASPLVPQDVKWGPNSPVFNVSFVSDTAPGYGALTTTQEAASSIELSIGEEYQALWQVTPQTGGSTPYWQLQPLITNHEILGTDTSAIVQFDISGVVVPVGFQPGPTSMYVEWANIPGYNDGGTSLEIQKDDLITEFSGQVQMRGNWVGGLILQWATVNADSVWLTAGSTGEQKIVPSVSEGYQVTPSTTDPLRYVYELTAQKGKIQVSSRIALEWEVIDTQKHLFESSKLLGAAVTPGGTRLFVNANSDISALDLTTKPITVLNTTESAPVGPLTMLPDGSQFLVPVFMTGVVWGCPVADQDLVCSPYAKFWSQSPGAAPVAIVEDYVFIPTLDSQVMVANNNTSYSVDLGFTASATIADPAGKFVFVPGSIEVTPPVGFPTYRSRFALLTPYEGRFKLGENVSRKVFDDGTVFSAGVVSSRGEVFIAAQRSLAVFGVDMTSASVAILQILSLDNPPTGIGVSPAGDNLLVLDDRGVDVYDAATIPPLRKLQSISLPSMNCDYNAQVIALPDGAGAFIACDNILPTSDDIALISLAPARICGGIPESVTCGQ